MIPAIPFTTLGMSIFVVAVIVIYSLLGILILGNYYKWRETNQPTNWILKRFPLVLSLIIIIAVGFIVYNSWIEWGRWQIDLSCEKDYGPPGGGNCGGKGEQTCQEAEQKSAMFSQCLKDGGNLDKAYPVGPANPGHGATANDFTHPDFGPAPDNFMLESMSWNFIMTAQQETA